MSGVLSLGLLAGCVEGDGVAGAFGLGDQAVGVQFLVPPQVLVRFEVGVGSSLVSPW